MDDRIDMDEFIGGGSRWGHVTVMNCRWSFLQGVSKWVSDSEAGRADALVANRRMENWRVEGSGLSTIWQEPSVVEVVKKSAAVGVGIDIDSGSRTEKGLNCGHWTERADNTARTKDRSKCHRHEQVRVYGA